MVVDGMTKRSVRMRAKYALRILRCVFTASLDASEPLAPNEGEEAKGADSGQDESGRSMSIVAGKKTAVTGGNAIGRSSEVADPLQEKLGIALIRQDCCR